MPFRLIKAALLDHSVDNERLADALIDASRDDFLRATAAFLRGKGHAEAADLIDPDKVIHSSREVT